MKNLYTNSAIFYDAIYPSSKFHDDIDFFVSKINKSSCILELGCGTGRVATILSQYCKEVHAVDLSVDMLKILTGKIETEKIPNIIIHNENMKDFVLDKKFDLIIFPFNSFQAFTLYENQIQCLNNCKKLLAKNGLLVINIFNPNMDFLNKFSSFKVVDYEGAIGNDKIKRETIGLAHCAENQTIKGQYAFSIANKNTSYGFVDDYELGYLYPEQLLKLTLGIGFDVAFQYENWTESEFQQNSNHYILGLKI